MWAFFSRRLRMWLLLAIALPLTRALVHRLTLAGPQGPWARVRGDQARLPGRAGPHRLLDPSGATLALCP